MQEPTPRFAIVGIGCRMPPAANSLDAFWRFLSRGGSALKPLERMRWDWRKYWDSDPARPGKTYAPKAALLDQDVETFEPHAFGISPREAASLDPQQRLLLEVVWEAFIDAGIPREQVAGSATGVFVGGFCLDHLMHHAQEANRHLLNTHTAGGVTMTVLSNRISHVFDLRGPSFTLDTACSSSLVAVHYACQSLRLGECDLAIAGGVNAMTRPDMPIIMSKGHFLSAHGECRTFDESAGGYTRGEGAGVLLIRRLEDALADGDPIHAIIRSSGVNQDGRTEGISLPNPEAQERLARAVWEASGISPGDADYIEAHGTGTQAGDPAETRALHRVFSQGRNGRKAIVGSVKTNIGHLEAAAGVAGMLKAIAVLKHREVPKHLHFKTPNPKIPFDEYCLEVPTTPRKLPSEEEKPTLYAAVNSFGYGGTNAHVVLESAPIRARASGSPSASGPSALFFPISAPSDAGLRDLAGKYAFLLGKGIDGSLDDLAYTLATRRSHLEFRAAVIADDAEGLREAMIAASTGQPDARVVTGERRDIGRGLVFVFTGMGPQWWAMGRELFENNAIARDTLLEVDAVFHPMAGWSLREAILADESHSRMERTEVAQPANFAIQLALVRVWASLGVHPSAVVGHSVGEVTSGFVAGVYSLEDAVRVSYHRSRLQQTTAGRGSMLAVGLSETEALRRIANRPGVSVAAINSFDAVTLSGDTDTLATLAAELDGDGIFQKPLRVEVAYHSPQMDPIHDAILSDLAALSPRSATLPLYSTAFGEIIEGTRWDAAYWWKNVRDPVRFADAIRQLIHDGYSNFLEIGPHPVLGNSIRECAATLSREIRGFVSIRRKEPEWLQIRRTLGALYCAGFEPDWSAVAPQSGRLISAPQTAWQRERLWVESERARTERLGRPGPVYLSRTIPHGMPTWEVEVNRNFFPFLPDHGVEDQTVFPGMGYLDAAFSATREANGETAVRFENIRFEKVLILEPEKLQHLVTTLDAEEGRYTVSSRVSGDDDEAQRHCRGRVSVISDPALGLLDLSALADHLPGQIEPEGFYAALAARGLRYGPAFQRVREIRRESDSYLVQIAGPDAAAQQAFGFDPTVLDAAIQAVLFCTRGDRLYVPFAIEECVLTAAAPGALFHAHGRLTSQSDSLIVADVDLADEAGRVVARIRGMACRMIESLVENADEPLNYERVWKESPLAERADLGGVRALVFHDAEFSDPEILREIETHCGEVRAVELSVRAEPVAVAEAIAEFRPTHAVVLWGSRVVEGEAGENALRLNTAVARLLRALGVVMNAPLQVVFVTCGAQSIHANDPIRHLAAAPIAALALTGHNEYEHLACRTVDFDSFGNSDAVVLEIFATREGDSALRDGRRFELVLQVRESESVEVESVSVDEPIAVAEGGLDFVRVARPEPGPGEVEIRVHRTGITHKDVFKAEGKIHPLALEGTWWGSVLGMECAGEVIRCGDGSGFAIGDRVAALVRGAFASYVVADARFVVRVPEGVSLDSAGSLVGSAIAWRALVEIANVRAGERVLVHHGTGAVGMAAIALARSLGAEVLATAGTPEKRALLNDLGVELTAPSRGVEFMDAFRASAPEGVDVVMGGQVGRALHAGLSLLRPGGRYIDLAKKEIAEDAGLPMRAFDRNLIYAALDIDRLANDAPDVLRRCLRDGFARIVSGECPAVPTRTVPAREIREAFADVAASRHTGRVLVDFTAGTVDIPRSDANAPIIRADGSYIITGGTSGFGPTTARWLAARGAGRIFLASRSGANAPGADALREELAETGCDCRIVSVDVTDADSVQQLVRDATSDGVVLRGILHGAMVLDDCLLADLTDDRFANVFRPKALGALRLVHAVAEPENLDFFVFHSSVSALVGNRGQANYVAANAFLDSLAHTLRARGVNAVAVNWGALGESGVVARDARIADALEAAGISALTNAEALDALARAAAGRDAQIGIFRVDWARWHEANPKLRDDPRFRDLRLRAEAGGAGVDDGVRGELAAIPSEKRVSAIEEHLREVLAETLKMPKDRIPREKKLGELGVDSLMVLELGLGIKKRLGVGFSAMEFLRGPNLQELAVLAEKKMWQ